MHCTAEVEEQTCSFCASTILILNLLELSEQTYPAMTKRVKLSPTPKPYYYAPAYIISG